MHRGRGSVFGAQARCDLRRALLRGNVEQRRERVAQLVRRERAKRHARTNAVGDQSARPERLIHKEVTHDGGQASARDAVYVLPAPP